MRAARAALTVTIAVWCGCYRGNAAVGDPCSTLDHACPSGQLCDLAQTPPTCVLTLVDASASATDAVATPGCGGSCPATAPVCDPTTNVCRGCEADVECADDACIESTGACVAAANVLYVAPAGTGSACTRAAPCPTISEAVALVTATQAMISVAAGTYADSIVLSGGNAGNANVPIVISGPSTMPADVTVDYVTSGGRHVIEIDRMAAVTLEGLTLAGSQLEALHLDPGSTVTAFAIAIGATAHGGINSIESTLTLLRSSIAGEGIGIELQSGMATIDRTIVDGATGAGLVVNNAAFAITNSMFVDNGNGGVQFQAVSTGSTTFAFDTVAGNTGVAIRCIDDSTAIADSIVSSPTAGDELDGCSATYSLFSSNVPTGTGNLAGDPLFVSATDFHIQPTSPAVDAADPAATDPIDFDGQARPIGAGWDIGADEAH